MYAHCITYLVSAAEVLAVVISVVLDVCAGSRRVSRSKAMAIRRCVVSIGPPIGVQSNSEGDFSAANAVAAVQQPLLSMSDTALLFSQISPPTLSWPHDSWTSMMHC